MSHLNDDEDVEDWLREHHKAFSPDTSIPTARQAIRPLFVGNVKKLCQHCGFEAAVELFRNGKCLACQAADFLGPLK